MALRKTKAQRQWIKLDGTKKDKSTKTIDKSIKTIDKSIKTNTEF